ncbi:hypothetical protein LA080_003101 [Diaporthe eres]|nr:hypothetical protein LA080_003101 [Diaporthe eres]
MSPSIPGSKDPPRWSPPGSSSLSAPSLRPCPTGPGSRRWWARSRSLPRPPGRETFDQDGDSRPPLVNAIFIKLHLLDHLHQPTLEAFDKRIPVFATAQAAPTIRGWGHFDTVVETRDYKSHWKTFHPGKPLPEWLGVFRLASDWEVEPPTALVWSHESHLNHQESGTNNEQHEFITNTPHGVDVNTGSVAAFFDDNVGKNRHTAGGVRQPGHVDGMQCLAILAGLKDSYSFGVQSTVGVTRSLQLERKAEPRYWVKSHDLPVRYGGAVMRIRITKEVIRTLEYGLEEETKARLKDGQVGGLAEAESDTSSDSQDFEQDPVGISIRTSLSSTIRPELSASTIASEPGRATPGTTTSPMFNGAA